MVTPPEGSSLKIRAELEGREGNIPIFNFKAPMGTTPI